ncbi:hypothetical protein GGR56DRAFT_258332 [Xylariaceae sp. FL0804]|nr:hypothetical protein GGR56DRAFT_258332 [Xylariaceae sp. FL0804]
MPTMSNLSRHIACKLCRDRKVRCDGGQPSCEKCRRSGETCVYVPTHKPTKADLAQTIESLQERLDKAEAYIVRHNGGNKSASSDQANRNTNTNTALQVDYADCNPFNIQLPSGGQTGDQFLPTGLNGISSTMPSTPYATHGLPLSPENMDNDFLNYLPSPHMTVRNEPVHYQLDDPRQYEDLTGPTTGSPFRRESLFGHPMQHMPSLREIRAINSSASTTPPPASPSGGRLSASSYGHRGEDANKILAELTAFGMAVFNTQAEIAGISSVVAEYLEWMRRAVPPPPSAGMQMHQIGVAGGGGGGGAGGGGGSGGAGGGTGPTNTAAAAFSCGSSKASPWAVLETLEARVRELHGMASTRHLDAWRQSVNMLEKVDGMGAMLGLFDGEMQRRSAETADFFQSGYDVCAALPGQQLMRKE